MSNIFRSDTDKGVHLILPPQLPTFIKWNAEAEATTVNGTISCTITIWKFIRRLPSAGKVTSHTWKGNIFSHQCTCNLHKLGGKSRRKSFEVMADDSLHCLLLNTTATTKKIDIKRWRNGTKDHAVGFYSPHWRSFFFCLHCTLKKICSTL